IHIVTNATLMTPELCDRLAELEPYQVDVSLYGATAATYESVTQVQGSFDAFLRGLDLLRAKNLPVLLKLVMMTLNHQEYDLMKEFARRRNLPYKMGADIHPRVD